MRSGPEPRTIRVAPSHSMPPDGIRTATAATSCTGSRSRSGSDPDRRRSGAERADLQAISIGASEHGLQCRIVVGGKRDPVDEAGELVLVDGLSIGAAQPAMKAEARIRI